MGILDKAEAAAKKHGDKLAEGTAGPQAPSDAQDALDDAEAGLEEIRAAADRVLEDGREKIPGGMRDGDQPPDQAEGMGMG